MSRRAVPTSQPHRVGAGRLPLLWRAPLIVLGIFLAIRAWDERGALVGVIALIVYGVGFALWAFRLDELRAWSRAHPALDSALLVPIAFLGLASLTDLALPACALIGVGLWLLLWGLVRMRAAR